MLREIGSNFWDYSVSAPERKLPFFWAGSEYNVQYFKSGRNAIKALCQNLKSSEKRAILPNYTCETVIQPFLEEGWDVSFFKINRDLTINEEDFQSLYHSIKPSVVLVHTYFGFQTLQNQAQLIACKKDGTVIVEDMTQSLFSNHYIAFADFYVTSFRKFFAIPDGGALIGRNDFCIVQTKKADEQITDVALDAFRLKGNYFSNPTEAGKEKFRARYQELNKLIGKNDEITSISPISLEIISSCDKESICAARKKNYDHVYEKLADFSCVQPVLHQRAGDCCPLYLPVYAENRSCLQSYLAQKNIYCPVIWPRPQQIHIFDNETRYMYDHMLCIPIDQRYGEEEMNYIIGALMTFDSMERKKDG